MKKVILSLMLSLVAMVVSAQVKSVDVKGDLRGDFGLGAGVTMGVVNKIDFSPRINYYFAGKGATVFTVDADFHYNFNVAKDWTVYPILGLVYYHCSWDTIKDGEGKLSDSLNKIGCNIGCGAQYKLTNNLGVFVEGKYQYVNGADDTYFSVGVNIGI